MREAARVIHRLGPRAVVIKGGHLGPGVGRVDLLFDGQRYVEFTEQTDSLAAVRTAPDARFQPRSPPIWRAAKSWKTRCGRPKAS